MFGKNRTEIFEGSGAAMGFTQDSDTLILEEFSWSFGFEMEPPPKLAFSIPSRERVDATASPSCWYGRNLSVDGSMCFAVGFHDSTPRVFRRNGDFVGYCYRHPSIVNAWFTRNNAELLSLHTDGALIRWDLSNVNEHKQVQSVSLSMQPELLKFHGVVPLNSESAFALIDRSGRMTRFVVPD